MKATFVSNDECRDDILECVCIGWDEAKARAFIDSLNVRGEFKIFSVEMASEKEIELYNDEAAGDMWIEWLAPRLDNPENKKYPFLAPDFLESFYWKERAEYEKE